MHLDTTDTHTSFATSCLWNMIFGVFVYYPLFSMSRFKIIISLVLYKQDICDLTQYLTIFPSIVHRCSKIEIIDTYSIVFHIHNVTFLKVCVCLSFYCGLKHHQLVIKRLSILF